MAFCPYNVNASLVAGEHVYSSNNPCPATLETAQNRVCAKQLAPSGESVGYYLYTFRFIGRMLHAAVVRLQVHIFGTTIDAARFNIRLAIASRNFRIVSERDFIRIVLQKLFADQWMRSHTYEGTRLARSWNIAGHPYTAPPSAKPLVN